MCSSIPFTRASQTRRTRMFTITGADCFIAQSYATTDNI